MLSKIEKTQLRADIFRHLDGIVTAPVAYILLEKGVCEYLLKVGQDTISNISKHFNANEGNLNVALRVLCSQGWLTANVDNVSNAATYSTNESSEFAFNQFHLYEDVVHLMKFSEQFDKRKFELEPFIVLENIIKNLSNNYGVQFSANEIEKNIQKQILKHIEGITVGPSIVALGMGGMFHKYFMEASFRPDEFHKDKSSFAKLLDFFTALDWYTKKNGAYTFTEKGLFFAKRASAYGVTVSYIPTFRHLNELIFGDPNHLWKVEEGSPEKHVDRAMNVWGSGGAHSTYFKKIDEILIYIFNKPIEEQPKGILDMGCGNGAFLEHIFDVIEQRTERGKHLEEHPLFLVGADYNQVAIDVSRRNLIQADIWAKVLWGDISRPDLLNNDLKETYNIELGDLLNVRTFLDHNRIWSDPEGDEKSVSSSTGAFAHRGRRISNNDVEANLIDHFKKWEPHVKKHGLLIIELHTIPPKITAQNIGKTAATAYDATHGFSDQYIIEINHFYKALKETGLYPNPLYQHKFPDNELATVSISLLEGK